MKVIAVVVTYNRLELLKRNIHCLRQNKPLDSILVVNNGSTDGTGQWLATQPDLHVLTQENVGGSGGFYTGMKAACEGGYDWIWCMDDDVFPEPDCLSRLLECDRPDAGILCPRRIQAGKIFVNECARVNLSNPFTSLHQGRLTPDVSEPTEIEGMVFEGPLIKREVVEKIGYPNKDLFIFYDDTDYSYRTILAGYKVIYVPQAHMQKELFFNNDSWKEKSKKKKWKRLYQVRNSAYFNHHYGKNFAVKYGRAFQGMFGYMMVVLFSAPFVKAYRLSDIGQFWKMYRDGIKEILGKL